MRAVERASSLHGGQVAPHQQTRMPVAHAAESHSIPGDTIQTTSRENKPSTKIQSKLQDTDKKLHYAAYIALGVGFTALLIATHMYYTHVVYPIGDKLSNQNSTFY